jgi:hypothetical protein
MRERAQLFDAPGSVIRRLPGPPCSVGPRRWICGPSALRERLSISPKLLHLAFSMIRIRRLVVFFCRPAERNRRGSERPISPRFAKEPRAARRQAMSVPHSGRLHFPFRARRCDGPFVCAVRACPAAPSARAAPGACRAPSIGLRDRPRLIQRAETSRPASRSGRTIPERRETAGLHTPTTNAECLPGAAARARACPR